MQLPLSAVLWQENKIYRLTLTDRPVMAPRGALVKKREVSGKQTDPKAQLHGVSTISLGYSLGVTPSLEPHRLTQGTPYGCACGERQVTRVDLRTTCKYANLYCRQDGIQIICSDLQDEKAICLYLGYKDAYIRIPRRVAEAYHIPEKFEFVDQGSGRYFIPFKCAEKLPKPLKVKLKSDFPFPERENAKYMTTKNYIMGKVSASSSDEAGTKLLYYLSRVLRLIL